MTDRAAEPPAPLTGLALSRGGLDRLADRRTDPHLLDELLADPATLVLGIRGDRMRVHRSGTGPDVLVTRAPEPQDRSRLAFFLGVAPGGSCGAAYVAVVEQAPGGPDPSGQPGTEPEAQLDKSWRTLRQCGAALADLDAGIFTTTLALTNWHATHRFCGRCGSPTEPVLGGWVRRCSQDGSEHFPRTDPAVIVSVIDDDDRLLLGRGINWPENQFSVLAGFVEPGESFEAAVAREVLEESGVQVTDVRLLGDQPWPFPSSIMVGATARAVTTQLRHDPQEMAEVRWVTRQEYAALLRAGAIRVPGGISIAKRIIERWLGDTVETVAGRPLVAGWRPS